jgi:hypothetical protein
MSGYRWPEDAPGYYPHIIEAWNGLARCGNVWWTSGAGGHGDWQNASVKLDLSTDGPQWTVADAGSKKADISNGPYYNDGRPTSTHTYWTNQCVTINGIERVMRLTDFGAYPDPIYDGGPQVNGFQTQAAKWDAAGTWADAPIHGVVYGTARDPRNDDIYVGGGNELYRWRAGTWTLFADWRKTQPVYPNPGFLEAWEFYPALVDVKRDRVVSLNPRNGPVHMQAVSITNPVITHIDITGCSFDPSAYPGFVHDLDGDRYVAASGGAVNAINPDTGACTPLPATTPAVNGTFSRLEYFPALGGIAYLPSYASPVLFLPTR